MEIPITYYLYLSITIFTIGLIGIFLNRKNLIVLLMSIELILLSANINFVSFSNYYKDIAGQIFVFFNLSVAAAEAAVGLAIIVIFFRKKDSIHIDDINTLKG
ncbi:MAG: NADH-quinone oxidoreductase subunit K [Alphaproteobacteria bacterium MarineAlpha6_Bin6]|nr:NADH-quinone oxidoreductase subunit NuoK [Pelagibacteraceae bacterium]PPR32337.1 MAG: NADH-quinone oxidoreductase subunit K [Alphaproteobacteria bacterium MarineAlpha6_Bin6]PPR32945.1 MAG: NADH-quinone oxidoreductase subunit K [Alphaproteobacteria bacterium MarineAlpha6_Bin5]|tara:strand:- start:14 stop:322 length:309 start_codon:yes stop_codon:yes gene_type:complete